MKVLISPGYGAGWSTWNDPKVAFDERIIKAFERGITREEMKELCKDLGYSNTYCGGFDTLKVVEIPSGTIFKIEEYDGSESIVCFDESEWYVAEGEYYDIN